MTNRNQTPQTSLQEIETADERRSTQIASTPVISANPYRLAVIVSNNQT